MRQLQFVSRGDKFTGVPEACRGFCRGDVDEARNRANDPAGDVVDFSEIHTVRRLSLKSRVLKGQAKIGKRLN